ARDQGVPAPPGAPRCRTWSRRGPRRPHARRRPRRHVDRSAVRQRRTACRHAHGQDAESTTYDAVAGTLALWHFDMHPLIHDWNRSPNPRPAIAMLNDETLRDGLQSPSVRSPTIDEKLRILHLIDALGIDTADIGLPGAGPHVVADVERLAREIVDGRLR